MQTLQLHIETAQRSIPVYVGKDLFSPLNTFIKEHFPGSAVFVITDSNLLPLYEPALRRAFSGLNRFCDVLAVAPGEASKSRQQKAFLEDCLFKHRAGRDSLIIAAGGGVVGDLAGYVAATFNRGIPLIHLPTSLLAMVDSSIGGKVGINHTSGKNLLGAFYHPAAVFCDLQLLNTLPQIEYLNGMAEVIKYAATLDASLIDKLSNGRTDLLKHDYGLLSDIIPRCIRLKMDVVAADEKENGLRAVLNFGHTVGHAIERLSGFQVKHGFAVAAGMDVALNLSQTLLGYPAEHARELKDLIKSYELNSVSALDYPLADIWQCIITDKKSRAQTPRFSLMREPGKPELYYPVTKQDLENVLNLS